MKAAESSLKRKRVACCVLPKSTETGDKGGYSARYLLWLSLILLLALTACGSNPSAELAPPTIHYGEDICEFCGMIISDERYAAGYLTEDGQEHIFDDIGNMVKAHLQSQDISPVRAFFVHGYEDAVWIRAETAHYVLSEELPTPMLSGIAACASLEKAEALAAERHGQLLTFDELLAYYQDNITLATDGHTEGHDEHR